MRARGGGGGERETEREREGGREGVNQFSKFANFLDTPGHIPSEGVSPPCTSCSGARANTYGLNLKRKYNEYSARGFITTSAIET